MFEAEVIACANVLRALLGEDTDIDALRIDVGNIMRRHDWARHYGDDKLAHLCSIAITGEVDWHMMRMDGVDVDDASKPSLLLLLERRYRFDASDRQAAFNDAVELDRFHTKMDEIETRIMEQRGEAM